MLHPSYAILGLIKHSTQVAEVGNQPLIHLWHRLDNYLTPKSLFFNLITAYHV